MPSFTYQHTHYYYDDRGSGTPIVFIHPPGMGRKVFYYQKLLARKFRVLMIDLSGHGDTIGYPKQVTIRNFANEVVALLDHLAIEKAVICGYSSGGCIAQEFALTYQDRTMALVLAGGFPEINSLFLRAEHRLGMYFIKHFPTIIIRSIARAHTTNRAKREMLIVHMKKANRKTWYDFYKQSKQYSSVKRLKKLQVPLLLLYGAKDFTNQHIRTYRKYTDIHVVFIKNGRHQIPFKNWRTVNKEIARFVNNNS